MLEIGLKGHQKLLVQQEQLASNMGSGQLDVFATPAVLALMEKTAWQSICDYLEPGYTTVGTFASVEHISATGPGMSVVCDSTLVKIEGRKLVFDIVVHDETGLIAKATHERVIVQTDRFLEKVNQKNCQ